MFLNFLHQIPELIFVIKILLFLFVSTSAGTYSLWPHDANLYLFQALPHYCMKTKVDTRMCSEYLRIT